MLPLKYPEVTSLSVQMPKPKPEEIRIFRVTPTVISVLDYSKGFGHMDLVISRARPQRSSGTSGSRGASGGGVACFLMATDRVTRLMSHAMLLDLGVGSVTSRRR